MSLRSRVGNLEKKAGNGFLVAFLEYASADGSRLDWASDTDESAVRFINAESLRIERLPDEQLADFDGRALAEALVKLDVTVWLHPSTRLV